MQNPVVRSLERVPARTRESSVTQSAWRMAIDSDSGAGAITLIESSDGSVYRGDGILLGWTQEELSAKYQELLAPDEEKQSDVLQLG
jgi:hypothetical protein